MLSRRLSSVLFAFLMMSLILACGSENKTQTVSKAGDPTATSGSAVGPTNEPEEPTAVPNPVGKIGDRIDDGTQALTLVSVEKKAALSDFQKAKEGNTFVVTEVLIEATGDEASYNPFYFKVKDSDGFEYTIDMYTGDGGLSSGDLKKGDKARGFVAFEVKESATGLIMSYEPLSFGDSEPIRFSLDN